MSTIKTKTLGTTILKISKLVQGNEHLREHGKKGLKKIQNGLKIFIQKGIEKAKDWHKSKEGRLWHSELERGHGENREYKKHKCEQCGSEFESRHGGIVKFCHNNCKAKALRKVGAGKL